MNMAKYFLFAIGLSVVHSIAWSQQKSTLPEISDSAAEANAARARTADSLKARRDSIYRLETINPRRAALYSAILPGAGQVYNKKYWKVPLVYAALGIPAYFYFNNKLWYQKTQYALAVVQNGSSGNADSLGKVDPKLIPFVQANDANDLIDYRNQFRQWQDYSLLFFLLFYTLNIVDATVDAHLQGFNVTNDLSLEIKPVYLPGTNTPGISLVFDLHKGKPKLIDLAN
jgi:Family of unknown function (DUF5683)